MHYIDHRLIEYNLDESQAPTIISNKLKGRVINKILQVDNPILAFATQKITKTDNQTNVPETKTALILLPKDLA